MKIIDVSEIAAFKRQGATVIGTHEGKFQADEVAGVATAILREEKINPGKEVVVVRSSNPNHLELCDIVIDVGRQYDAFAMRFDHHQMGIIERVNGVPYASAGLVWGAMGADIIAPILTGVLGKEAARMVDEAFVQAIDATDNSFNVDSYQVVRTPRYSVSQVIGDFNPTWVELKFATNPNSMFDSAFCEAVVMTKRLLNRVIANVFARIEAVPIVGKAIESKRHKEVIVLEHYCPWKEVVVKSDPEALYVVHPDVSREKTWIVNTVPLHPSGGGSRKPFPSEWAGLVEADLYNVSAVRGAKFCHPHRHIAGAYSLIGAIELALASARH